MRYIASASASILVCALIFAIVPSAGDLEIYDNMIRLHVVANSDSEADQALKLDVRDAIVELLGGLLGETQSRAEAEETVRSALGEIEAAAADIAGSAGGNFSVSAVLSPERYPTCEYGGFRLPAGEYLSLRVIIGEGDGKNWWCVLFPPLCTSAALGAKMASEDEFVQAGLTPGQYKIIAESDGKVKYKLKFKILEFFGSLYE